MIYDSFKLSSSSIQSSSMPQSYTQRASNNGENVKSPSDVWEPVRETVSLSPEGCFAAAKDLLSANLCAEAFERVSALEHEVARLKEAIADSGQASPDEIARRTTQYEQYGFDSRVGRYGFYRDEVDWEFTHRVWDYVERKKSVKT